MINRLYFDTNALLDLLDQERTGHAIALHLERHIESRSLACLCSWHTLSILDYLASKRFGRKATHQLIRGLLDHWEIPTVGTSEAIAAFRYLSGDYEDALQIAAAVAGNADRIVTNDRKGFSKSPISVITTELLCQELAS